MKKIFLTIVSFFCFFNTYSQTSKDYFNKGFTKVESNDFVGAIANFNKAIEINPQNYDAYYYRGYSKTELQDYRGAIQDFNKALQFNPNESSIYYCRGLAKLHLGQTDSGCLDLSKAGELGDKQAYNMIQKYCN